MAFGKGGGSSLLDAIGMKPKKKSFFGKSEDDKEPAEESSPDLGGAEEEGEDTGAMDMALDDFADALGLDGDKREEAISALKQAISACVNGGGEEDKGGLGL